MLYLDSPVGSFFGITVFRDHADPDLFYYASERPRLSVNDGTAEFVFLIYQSDVTDNPALSDADKDQLGGGYLAFTVDLGVDEEVLKEVRKPTLTKKAAKAARIAREEAEDAAAYASMGVSNETQAGRKAAKKAAS